MKPQIRTLIAAVMLSLLTPAAFADQFTLAEGTEVRLRLLDALSSKTNHNGDEVRFEVMDDVTAADGKTVLIKEGTRARGTVNQSRQKGMVGQKGEISISAYSTKDVNGNKVKIRGTFTQDGHGKLGSVVALSVVVTPLFLLMHGRDADIAAGACVTAYTDEDKIVEIAAVAPTSTTSVSATVITPAKAEKTSATP